MWKREWLILGHLTNRIGSRFLSNSGNVEVRDDWVLGKLEYKNKFVYGKIGLLFRVFTGSENVWKFWPSQVINGIYSRADWTPMPTVSTIQTIYYPRSLAPAKTSPSTCSLLLPTKSTYPPPRLANNGVIQTRSCSISARKIQLNPLSSFKAPYLDHSSVKGWSSSSNKAAYTLVKKLVDGQHAKTLSSPSASISKLENPSTYSSL